MSTSETSDMSTATKLFTEASLRTVRGFGLISSFRRIASLRLESSVNQIYDDWRVSMDALLTDPDYEGILVPIDPNATKLPNMSRIARQAAELEMDNFGVAVDAACLVFAQSILDDAALQYCRVTSIVSPSSWEPFVINRTVKLEDVRNENYQSLLTAKIEDSLNKLERESLLMKFEKVFQICQPKPDFKPIKGFSFDRSRLESLDRLRHAIIHQTGPVQRLPKGDDDLHFMKLCAVYLMSLVHHCFGVKVDLREPVEPGMGVEPTTC